MRIVVTRLPTNELLALACCGNPRHALAGYRQRWTIETLFANLKSKGFNLEDTRITALEKLSTLLAVLALTVTLCVKTGFALARWRPRDRRTRPRPSSRRIKYRHVPNNSALCAA